MPQCVTREVIRPCLIRMKGTGNQKKPKSRPQESTLSQFGNPDDGRVDRAAEKKLSGVQDHDQDLELPTTSFEQGEWWLRVKLEHPHNAIDLIETYKRITGTPYRDVCYQLDITDPTGLKRRPLVA
jgi:hypothetical protein